MEEGRVVGVGLCRLEAFDKHAVHHGRRAVGAYVNHHLMIKKKKLLYDFLKLSENVVEKLRASLLLKRKRTEFMDYKSC
jgi:hypothetical protein